MQSDLNDYKRRQRQSWGSSIGLHRLSGHFQPASERLIEWLQVSAGDRVLDVATGTGRTAVLARATGAAVEAQDLSPVLLSETEHFALASGYTDIVVQESDVELLPHEAERFSVVVSTFGAIHAPRPDIACSEMARVLQGSGRLGLAVWPHDSAIHQLTGIVPGSNPQEPGVVDIQEWGRPARIREFISQRHFPKLEFEEGLLEIAYPTIDAAWRDWSRNYGPIRSAYMSIPLRNRDSIDQAARKYFSQWSSESGSLVWPLSYLLVKATKIDLTQRVG